MKSTTARGWLGDIRERLTVGLRLVKFQWAAAPLAFTLGEIGNILQQVFQRLLIVATGIMIDGIVRAQHEGPSAITPGLILMAIVLFVQPLNGQLTELANQRQKSQSSTLANVSLVQWSLNDSTLESVSDPQKAATWKSINTKLHEWFWLYWNNANLDNLNQRIGALLSFGIVASWNWWVALLLAFGHVISSWIAGSWNELIFQEFDAKPGSDLYRAEFLRKKLMDSDSAKEVRLFGWADWFVGEFRRLWDNSLAQLWPTRAQMSRRAVLAGLVQILTHTIAIAAIIAAVQAENLSAGLVLTVFGAITTLSGLGFLGFPQAVARSNAELISLLVVGRRKDGLAPVANLRHFPPPAPAELNAAVRTEPTAIAIENMSFGYPNREPIFQGLNIHIPAGQSVAIVGVNGAGKSTLIKLLCGLYHPTSGTIRLNSKAPLDARGDIAVVFQEFEHYHRTLAENIAVGAFGAQVPQEILDRVLEQARGRGLLTGERGWDTILSAEYDGGTDLSGGQWQRVALARAFTSLAAGAGLLILDEPTSALDVRAEKELFDDFLSVTRGATTILVTHRLAAVRRAERIIVIEHGRVVADASHEEHMRAGGLYADMFRLQASRYLSESMEQGRVRADASKGIIP